MTDHDLSAPAYHSLPQVVAPTSVLYPAVRPMSASKQFQEHSGWGTTSSRDTCTPVQVDEKGKKILVFVLVYYPMEMVITQLLKNQLSARLIHALIFKMTFGVVFPNAWLR